MADINSVNYEAVYVTSPKGELSASEYGGKLRYFEDSQTLSSAAIGDDLNIAKVGEGQVITPLTRVYHNPLGASTTLALVFIPDSGAAETTVVTAQSTSGAGVVEIPSALSGLPFKAAEAGRLVVRVGGAAASGGVKSMVVLSFE